MKSITSPAFSQSSNPQKRLYKIIDSLQVEVSVTSNPYRLELDHLFQMAARMNKKRGFLFVSKLLGKHIPVQAALSLSSGAVLGCLYESWIFDKPTTVPADELQIAIANTEKANALYKRLMDSKIKVDEPTLFIGFAETATALGHSMFDAFEGNVAYLHTTREQIDYLDSLINFEEEHSHAVSHRCYAGNPGIFTNASRVVLVDDEITTGNTSLNIIKELHKRFGHRDFVVASLLDWRSAADRERFAALESELGIRIRCLSLLEGTISVEGSPLTENMEQTAPIVEGETEYRKHSISPYFEHTESATQDVSGPISEHIVPYLKLTGRFGINDAQNKALQREIVQAAEYMTSQRMGKRTLCMGTGEFMYIPMRIASLMGDGVFYQSTTRSPIYPSNRDEYAVTSAYRFDSSEDANVDNFMYNLTPGQYDEIFVFIERELEPQKRESFERVLRKIGIPLVHLVYFSE
ncbi:phosphoribosyltransferase family protein [Cohnella sp.]|uniref:phosphoribosyltransferase family protein n=1 Tax=Cohnella sp. TaxID=1883426 RepID=UPI00356B4F67